MAPEGSYIPSIGSGGFARHGERKTEGTPLPLNALNGDRSVQLLNDKTHARKPQPVPLDPDSI